MRTLIVAIALAAVSVASSAFAGTAYLNQMNESAPLTSCGGAVELTNTFGFPALRIVGNSECSNIVIDGRVYKSQTYAKIALREGTTYATIESNSGKHRDSVIINVRPTFGAQFSNGAAWQNMPSCGGTAELKVAGGAVNLIFRGVEDCSNFDILSSNGEYVNYPNQKLGGFERNRSGSFTLPRSMYQFGFNGVKVVLKSNSGKHGEVLYIRFLAD